MLRSSVSTENHLCQLIVQNSDGLGNRVIAQIQSRQFVTAQNNIRQLRILAQVHRGHLTVILAITHIQLSQLGISRQVDGLEVIDTDGKSLQGGQLAQINSRQVVLVQVEFGDRSSTIKINGSDTIRNLRSISGILRKGLEVNDSLAVNLHCT